MIPISGDYFVDQLKDIPDKKYVHLSPLNYLLYGTQASLYRKENPGTATITRFPVCYHVARGSLLKEVLKLPEDWGQAMHKLAYYHNRYYPQEKEWGVDEVYSTMKIHEYENQSVFRLLTRQRRYPEYPMPRKGPWRQCITSRRIDKYYSCVYNRDWLKQGYYLDVHVPRPCTPEHLSQMDLLLKGEPSPVKDAIILPKKMKLQTAKRIVSKRLRKIRNILFHCAIGPPVSDRLFWGESLQRGPGLVAGHNGANLEEGEEPAIKDSGALKVPARASAPLLCSCLPAAASPGRLGSLIVWRWNARAFNELYGFKSRLR